MLRRLTAIFASALAFAHFTGTRSLSDESDIPLQVDLSTPYQLEIDLLKETGDVPDSFLDAYATFHRIAGYIDSQYIHDADWNGIASDMIHFLQSSSLFMTEQDSERISELLTLPPSTLRYEGYASRFAEALHIAYTSQGDNPLLDQRGFIELASKRLVGNLDTHSRYLTPAESHRSDNISGGSSIPLITKSLYEENVGYIKLRAFREGADETIDRIIRDLIEDGATSFILDLRGNRGGLFSEAVAIADNFLDRGIIATQIDVDEALPDVYTALSPDVTGGMPLIVLVDERSASSSEVLMAALKENGRATVIGERSRGKGVFQHIIPLHNDDELRITGGYQLTPSGQNVHRLGIEPDIIVPDAAPGIFDALQGIDIDDGRQLDNPLGLDEYHAVASNQCVREGELNAVGFDSQRPAHHSDLVLMCALEQLTGQRHLTRIEALEPAL